MNTEEKERLIEILFYLYFNSLPEATVGSTAFWNAIKALCMFYHINDLDIVKAIRILTPKENCPQDDETYFLLHKLGVSVRPINKITGIYWQKQKKFDNIFAQKAPVIRHRVTDPMVKASMKNFLVGMYNIMGIFTSIDYDLFKEIV